MPTVMPFALPGVRQASGEHTRHGTHAASIMGNENPAQIQRKAGDLKYGEQAIRNDVKGGGHAAFAQRVKVCQKVRAKTRLKRAQKPPAERKNPNKTGHFGIRKRPKKGSKLGSKRALKIQ